MGNVVWTDEALAWLREIRDYIAEQNPQAAVRVAKGLYDKVESLRQFPDRGFRYGDDARGIPVRVVLYGHYRIAYQVDEERRVTVLGIFHGSLDIERLLD